MADNWLIPSPAVAPLRPESTVLLLSRARTGDAAAANALFARTSVSLRRWAHGRLPRWARDLSDTQDLVQDTLVQAFRHLETFEPRGAGAFQAYVRQAVLNRIRHELRRLGRRPMAAALDSQWPGSEPSPLRAAIGREQSVRFGVALSELRPDDRALVIARIEWGYDYTELAKAFGRPTANAARMAVQRAIAQLLLAMRRHESETARTGRRG